MALLLVVPVVSLGSAPKGDTSSASWLKVDLTAGGTAFGLANIYRFVQNKKRCSDPEAFFAAKKEQADKEKTENLKKAEESIKTLCGPDEFQVIPQSYSRGVEVKRSFMNRIKHSIANHLSNPFPNARMADNKKLNELNSNYIENKKVTKSVELQYDINYLHNVRITNAQFERDQIERRIERSSSNNPLKRYWAFWCSK